MLVQGVREKSLDMKIIVCFRRVGSPNQVVVVNNKHSPLFPAIFQPEGTNCEQHVEIVEEEADLTPPSSGTFIRRNRIIAGRNLVRNTLLL